MKQQFMVWTSLALLVLAFGLTAYSSHGQREVRDKQAVLAEDGAEAHQALCAFKKDLATRVANSQEFLSLSPDERIAKYGEALGTIPPKTIRTSLANQRQTLISLNVLTCS